MSIDMNELGQLLIGANRSLVIAPSQQQLNDLSLGDRHLQALAFVFSAASRPARPLQSIRGR